MGRTRVAEQLQSVPLFAACSRSDLKIVARHAVEVEVPSNTVVVREGETGDSFYVVLDGEAVVRRKVGRTNRKVGVLGPGSWFGELALLDPSPRNATVMVSTPATLAVIDARVFRAMLRDVPAMSTRLLAGLARRLREADARAVG